MGAFAAAYVVVLLEGIPASSFTKNKFCQRISWSLYNTILNDNQVKFYFYHIFIYLPLERQSRQALFNNPGINN